MVGHVFTVSIIRLLRELEGVFSLSLFPFGLFSPSPPIPFFVPAMQDNFPDFLTYIHTYRVLNRRRHPAIDRRLLWDL